MNDSIAAMRWLIDRGASDLNRALTRAAQSGRIQAMTFLIGCGACDFDRGLVFAAMGGRLDAMRLMVDHGASCFARAIAAIGTERVRRARHLSTILPISEAHAAELIETRERYSARHTAAIAALKKWQARAVVKSPFPPRRHKNARRLHSPGSATGAAPRVLHSAR